MLSGLYLEVFTAQAVFQTLAKLTVCLERASVRPCAMRTAAFSGVSSLFILAAWCAEGLPENPEPETLKHSGDCED